MTSYEFIKKLNDLRTAKEIHFEGLDKGFCVHVPNFVENIQERLNDLTESIHEKIRLLEISKVAKLDRVRVLVDRYLFNHDIGIHNIQYCR